MNEYDHIKKIIKIWEDCSLSDIDEIIKLRRDLSVYYYRLAEIKAIDERGFLTWETQRKSNFYHAKMEAIESGKSAAASEVIAETRKDVVEARKEEVTFERDYKKAKDILSSLDHVLNSMSSAINQATNERKQSNYHT